MKAATNIGRRTMWFVGVFLVLIFALVAYMITKSMNDADKMREELVKQIHQ